MGNDVIYGFQRTQEYNETEENSIPRGHGLLGSFVDSELIGGSTPSPSPTPSTGDTYSKSEIDAKINAINQELSKKAGEVTVNTDGDQEYMSVLNEGDKSVIDFSVMGSSDVDDIVK